MHGQKNIKLTETTFFPFFFFDTISEDGADTVYANDSDKLTFTLQQDRRTKI